jgi:hypothetical protein
MPPPFALVADIALCAHRRLAETCFCVRKVKLGKSMFITVIYSCEVETDPSANFYKLRRSTLGCLLEKRD